MIRVRIPLRSTVLSVNVVWIERKKKQKEGQWSVVPQLVPSDILLSYFIRKITGIELRSLLSHFKPIKVLIFSLS